MNLYIAEKPSLARAIANGLSSSQTKHDGYISLPNGDVVSWCIGHLLEQATPEHYDECYKKWSLDYLPISPQQWQLIPKPKTKKQIGVLRKLIKQASVLVNAGDPDREGQLLVDEVIHYCGVKGTKLAQTKRLLVSDLNLTAVKKSLANLRVNEEFKPLSASALARSRADWLYGMNMTRAYTVLGQRAGYQGVLSVGRVQTPVLGLVVARDEEIEHFVAKPFYEVVATLTTQANESFDAKWIPSDACEKYQDDEGRVIYRKLAENVVARTSGQPAVVKSVDKQKKRLNQPLPYNLSALQIDAAKRFNLSAKQVLDCCQVLYEKHKLITYPRSDNRYLPKEHFREGAKVVAAIANNDSSLADAVNGCDTSIKSKAWNDSKVDAHHAIIPTMKQLKSASLSGTEANVYSLIARQYLAQFYPVHHYSEMKVEIDIAGGEFRAKAKSIDNIGWKTLFKHKSEDVILPALSVGQPLNCQSSQVIDKMTQPPKPFSDATLLAAMTGIARYVKDPAIKKVLKETDGLGTEATRASIIELLFKRGFLTRNNKSIHATNNGKALIKALPQSATTPDMTALWEAKLNDISQKQLGYNGFMQPLLADLDQLMNQAKHTPLDAFTGLDKGSPAKQFKKRRSYRGKASNTRKTGTRKTSSRKT
ncbi:DNA topoisomerase III [Psychrobium sp. MM17-31]|uniref:DNA topoisomerase III n=1 Tax=Psychrobium sp. MM17-31 TaxID=2917758 RepID=UPI001EF4DEDF|nr:DNA topoisomerase III [Psychrobium sp. MM17-31]MCG7531876.1 DNA topoisomerase III [Psychrobium sp. MM17-31]